MARGRMLSKSLGASRKFAAAGKLSVDIEGRPAEFPQLLYQLLIPHSDDFGRQPGDAFTVKLIVFPSSSREEADFERALSALESTNLIVRYQTPLGQVLQIVDFDPHQSGLHKRSKSKFPAPPGTSGDSREFPGDSGDAQNRLNFNLPEIPGSSGDALEIPPELNRTELNRTELIYSGAGAPPRLRVVEKSNDKKTTSAWKRALGIAHQVIRDWPENPENWTYETKDRLALQHMDPLSRSPRGGSLFADSVEYAIQQRREQGEPNCGRRKRVS